MFVRKATTDTSVLLHRETIQKHGSHDQKTHGRKGGGGGGGGGSGSSSKEPQDQGQRNWDTKNTLRTANRRDITGTSYKGKVTATRQELTDALGKPDIGGMDKSTIEWAVADRKTGAVATVYDYKRSPSPGSRSEYATEPPKMDEVLEYNIGGNSADSVSIIENALFQSKKYNREKNN